MKKTIDEVMRTIEAMFEEFGETVSVETEYSDSEDDFKIFKQFDDDIYEMFVNEIFVPFQKYTYSSGEECLYDLANIAETYLKKYGYMLEEWDSAQAFDSPGCDIYVMSYVVRDLETGKIFYSFHNFYERI